MDVYSLLPPFDHLRVQQYVDEDYTPGTNTDTHMNTRVTTSSLAVHTGTDALM